MTGEMCVGRWSRFKWLKRLREEVEAGFEDSTSRSRRHPPQVRRYRRCQVERLRHECRRYPLKRRSPGDAGLDGDADDEAAQAESVGEAGALGADGALRAGLRLDCYKLIRRHAAIRRLPPFLASSNHGSPTFLEGSGSCLTAPSAGRRIALPTARWGVARRGRAAAVESAMMVSTDNRQVCLHGHGVIVSSD